MNHRVKYTITCSIGLARGALIIDTLLLVARLALAAVFAVAGIAKLADPAGSRKAMSGFGVPGPLIPSAALALPLAELATAVALVPNTSAWAGATGALCLLALFIAGISWSLAHGRAPDCHCFGQLHSAPAGASTLLRNVALAALAGFILVLGRDDPGYSAVAWLGVLSTVEAGIVALGAVAGVLFVVQGWFLWHVLQQNGRLLLRIEAIERSVTGAAGGTASSVGPPPGSPAPAFALDDLDNEQVSLDSVLAMGKPALLVFTDPACGPCNTLMPEVARWQTEHQAIFQTIVISRGAFEANRAKASEHGLAHVLLQPDRQVSDVYGCAGTPCAVLVSPEGTIVSLPAEGPAAIRSLAELAADASQHATVPVVQPQRGANSHSHVTPNMGPAVGEPAPPLTLTDLDGREVQLAQFRGRRVAVLFWNPQCGFCQRTLPDLKHWELEGREEPSVLVVSRGTTADNRAMGLRSIVLLDEGFTAGRAFGATGTPSAVLIDKEGRVVSPVAVGGPAVLALVRSAPP